MEGDLMKVLSLFDGISCGMVALERTGLPVSRYVAYEIDKYAIQVSKKNYPQIEHCGDVSTADFTKYKGFDLLLGGSPCTYWSIAKNGRETTSSGLGWDLFMQYKRALVESGAKYFLYENNYSIHKDIKDAITKELGVEPIMINSALVSAQQRKRCYWTNISNVTQPEDKGIVLQDIIESGVTGGVKCYRATDFANKGVNLYCKDEHNAQAFKPIKIGDIGGCKSQGYQIYSVKGKSLVLLADGGGIGSNSGLYKIDLSDGDYVIRKLTPLECERSQTLPDDYTFGISNTQRYKSLGNGWTVDVIAHILKSIY